VQAHVRSVITARLFLNNTVQALFDGYRVGDQLLPLDECLFKDDEATDEEILEAMRSTYQDGYHPWMLCVRQLRMGDVVAIHRSDDDKPAELIRRDSRGRIIGEPPTVRPVVYSYGPGNMWWRVGVEGWFMEHPAPRVIELPREKVRA
jgi:hypothetical protein